MQPILLASSTVLMRAATQLQKKFKHAQDFGVSDNREALVTTRKISIELSEDEVLVLFEWLHRVNESPQIEFEDQAEQRVVWDLEAALESANPALFASDYRVHLREARDRVRDPDE